MDRRECPVEKMVDFWRNRRVFLTGHTGFKGGWLAVWLASLGATVRGYSLDPQIEPTLFSAAGIGRVVDDRRGDIRDYTAVEAAIAEFDPEVIFHLAAQPLVRRSYADPIGTYETNVIGTVHVLQAARKSQGVRAVVCVTTDKCYENREWAWPYRETDTLGGRDPYSSSKACAELVVAAFRSSFFCAQLPQGRRVALATARAGNVLGGGDWSEDRLIPDLIRGFLAGQTVRIRNPKAIRPWQHVLEPLAGYLLLAQAILQSPTQFSSAYNFGPSENDAWSVEQIATKLAAIRGEGANWEHHEEKGVHEANVLRLDVSKARLELGWRPHLGINEALEWTMYWYRQWERGANMYEETLAQISAYEKLAGFANAPVVK